MGEVGEKVNMSIYSCFFICPICLDCWSVLQEVGSKEELVTFFSSDSKEYKHRASQARLLEFSYQTLKNMKQEPDKIECERFLSGCIGYKP